MRDWPKRRFKGPSNDMWKGNECEIWKKAFGHNLKGCVKGPVEIQIEKDMFKGSRLASLNRECERHFERTPTSNCEKDGTKLKYPYKET